MLNDTPITSGYKRCSKGDTCVNPNGSVLPISLEYFYKDARAKDGLGSCCKLCHLAATRKWKQSHPEDVKRLAREWDAKNPEKRKSVQHKYYWSHRDQEIAESRKYRANNPSMVIASLKSYRQRHPDYWKRWGANNRDKANAAKHRRRARARALVHDFAPMDWQRALDYFGHTCAVCGRPQGLWHTLAQDHWIPLVHDGEYTLANIVPLCHGLDGCNNSKSDKMPEQWLIERYGKRKAKQIIERIQAYFKAVAK